MKVGLIGTGCGDILSMSLGAVSRLRDADLILGAGRILDGLPQEWGRHRESCIDPEKIADRIVEYSENNPAIDGFGNEIQSNICVVFSGDSGFYSGTRPLLPLLEERNIEAEVIPGISSVQMLSARLGRPWQDWKLTSAHGINCDAAEEVEAGVSTFFLTGGRLGPGDLCQQLVYARLGSVPVIVGERLSYEDERIYEGTAVEFAGEDFDSLSVLLVDMPEAEEDEKLSIEEDLAAVTGMSFDDELIGQNEGLIGQMEERLRPGLADDMFIRGDVPMTKRDVRALIAGYMQVGERDVLWDIGSGTGSVSVELGLQAREGMVYAVERDHEGVMLTGQNLEHFALSNVQIVEGSAPEALEELPPPDRVFIGGSGGRLEEIIDAVLEKNYNALICLTAILIETAASAIRILEDRGLNTQIAQISSSTGRGGDGKHMLIGNNPIFIITGSRQ